MKIEKFLTKRNRTLHEGRKPEWIVIHYTGNKTDTARGNCNYFSTTYRGSSAHYFVDRTSIYMCVDPHKADAWAVGRNYGKNNLFDHCKNTNSISIEMCSNNGAIADETIALTVELTKALMQEFGISASYVVRHYDVCSKRCPGWDGWLPPDEHLWRDFKAALVAESPAHPAPDVRHIYRVRKTWSDPKSQIGAYASLANAKEACKEGYAVFDEAGNAVYSKAAPAPAPAPDPAPKPQLVVDGSWGQATTRAVQKMFGVTPDGIISSQPTLDQKYLPACSTTSWEFKAYGATGSLTIKRLQAWCGTTADGYCGRGTVRALQAKLGVTADGYCGRDTVRALQTYLNNH